MTFNVSADQAKASGIYKIEDIETGKFYIGSAKLLKRRFYAHRFNLEHNNHPNSHLQNIFNIRSHCLVFVLCETVLDTSRILVIEQEWLQKSLSDPLCINVAKVAVGHHKTLTRAEIIAKRAATNKAKCHKRTPEQKDRMRHAALGRKRSDEAKRKTSESLRKKHEETLIPFEVFQNGKSIGIFKRQKDFYSLGILSNVSISQLLSGKKSQVKGVTAFKLNTIWNKRLEQDLRKLYGVDTAEEVKKITLQQLKSNEITPRI